MKRTGNILWGIAFIIIGGIFALNAIGITDINIFFDGWWTLFIIIPSFIGIVTNDNKMWSMIWFLVGIVFLLCAQGILQFSMIRKLIFPVILILIGISILFKDAIGSNINKKISELNKQGLTEYYATFSGQKVSFDGEEFKGASVNAVFGGIEVDLRNSIITSDQVINVSAIFGGVDIFAPQNVNVKVKSTPIFGGVGNKVANTIGENVPTIYINAFCLFGGADIK